METQFPLFCFGWRGAHGGEGREVFEASTTLHTCLVCCFIFHERDSHPKRNGATCASFDAFRWDWDTLPVFFSYPISSHQSNQIVSPFLHTEKEKRKRKKEVDSWYKSILDIVNEHQEWLDQKKIIYKEDYPTGNYLPQFSDLTIAVAIINIQNPIICTTTPMIVIHCSLGQFHVVGLIFSTITCTGREWNFILIVCRKSDQTFLMRTLQFTPPGIMDGISLNKEASKLCTKLSKKY